MIGLIFDFDGPIFDGRKALNEAVRDFWEINYPTSKIPSIDNLALMRSSKLFKVICSSKDSHIPCPEEKIHEFSHFLSQKESESGINRDIKSILNVLHKNSNVKMAIYSNRQKEDLIRVTKNLGIDSNFDRIYGRDSFEAKPSIKALEDFMKTFSIHKKQITFFGDSDVDCQTAMNAGISYYHLSYTNEPCSFAWHNSRYIIKNEKEFINILKSISQYPVEINTTQVVPTMLQNSIKDNTVVFYTGSGISIDSGFGDWSDAYSGIYEKLDKLHLFKTHDIPNSLQLIFEDGEINRNAFSCFKEEFSKDAKPNKYHHSILKASQGNIWTTNYDQLFESAIHESNLRRTVIYSDKDLKKNISRNDLVIKVNGDFEHADYDYLNSYELILTQEQFDLFEQNRAEIWRAFEDDYRKKTIIFVGTSLNDPALKRILSIAKRRMPVTSKNHYILLKKCRDLIESQFQQFQISSLKKYSIETLLFDEYSEIVDFIQKLAIMNRRPIIGFSGSIDDKTDGKDYYLESLFTKDETEIICSNIAIDLVNQDYRVTSGCGSSVGKPAVQAAFQKKERYARYYFRKDGGHGYLGNAPAVVVNDISYKAMRKAFINELSVLLVFGGRIKEDGSSGLEEEINMAALNNVPVIMFPQFGGWIKANIDKANEILKVNYSNTVYKEVSALNEHIMKMNKEEISNYIKHYLVNDVESILKFLMGIGVIDKSDPIYNIW